MVAIIIPGPNGPMIAGKVAGVTFSLAYTDNRTDSGTTQTITYNAGGNPGIGSADANRIVAVGMFRRTDSSSPVSVTIGGVSATQVTGAAILQDGVMLSDIWYAAVPTGTTATVVIDWGGSVFSDSGIALYRIITGTAAPTTAKSAGAASGAVSLPSYVVPAGGASINIFAQRDDGAGAGATWTNATEDFDVSITGRGWSGATVSSAGSVTVTANPVGGGGSQQNVVSAAAWGP